MAITVAPLVTVASPLGCNTVSPRWGSAVVLFLSTTHDFGAGSHLLALSSKNTCETIVGAASRLGVTLREERAGIAAAGVHEVGHVVPHVLQSTDWSLCKHDFLHERTKALLLGAV